MSKKIYVTGCAGMIGSNICSSLVAQGHNVIGVDNLWRGTSANMAAFHDAKNFVFRHADIVADMDWHRDMDSNSTIVHAADIVGGIEFVFQNEWSIFQKNNLINTQIARLVQTARPEQLIYLGTACSYPQGMQQSTQNSVLQETDKYPAEPESGYGWSKLLGDIEFHLAIKGASTRLMVLDLHNVYGWPCVYANSTSQVIPALIYKSIISPDKSLTIWGNGSQGRAFVHVSDVVRAVEMTLTYTGNETNIMIGPDFCTQIKELVKIIQSHPEIEIETLNFDTTKPTGDIGRYANNSRAKAELGWNPSIEFIDGIYDMIDHIINHHRQNMFT